MTHESESPKRSFKPVIDEQTKRRLFEDACKATPKHVLETQLMDSRIPKSEVLHYARDQIIELRAENERLRDSLEGRNDILIDAHNELRAERDTLLANWETQKAETGRLRTKNEALRAELSVAIPVDAIRAIVVEAIRDATGCPDIKGLDGKYLVDKIEALARQLSCA